MVLAVAIVIAGLVGAGAVLMARRPAAPLDRPGVANDPAAAARARAEEDRMIAEARNQALAAREAVREEVLAREQAVEATDALAE